MSAQKYVTGDDYMLRNDYVRLLSPRRYLLEGKKTDENAYYYAAYLANHFAVIVDNPAKLCKENVKDMETYFGLSIPASFYKNPQDTKYYTCEELLVEQLVSYFMIEGNERSEYPELFKNPEIVEKVLPDYADGNEFNERKYHVVSKEEADVILTEAMKNYCGYTRPWSSDEKEEVKILLRGDYYHDEQVKCRDNIAAMYVMSGDGSFASQLDRKDVVKLSISLLGDNDPLVPDSESVALLKLAATVAKPCPMTKKQAKYFNKIVRFSGADVQKADNSRSPYAIAKKMVAKGDVVGAARYLNENGSLLLRNIVWLISRAKEGDVDEILAISDGGSPVASLQLLFKLSSNESGGRVFKFFSNGKIRTHCETDKEISLRRSRISEEVREKIKKIVLDKLHKYYASATSYGKIYVSEAFKKVAIPLNTSASGKGIDVLPTGSRIPMKGDFIRVFCYWHGVFDLDLAIVFGDGYGTREKLNWENYAIKPFGDSVLLSGDDRSSDGAEFADIDVEKLKELGWKYAVVLVNGYGEKLDRGRIYCGYQDKKDLNTQVWMPENITMQMHIKGDSNQFTAFAVDLERREIVVLNLLGGRYNDVASSSDANVASAYLDPGYLETLNMYDLLSMRGELVNDPEKADIVFDAEYEAKEGQTAIRPWDVERLVGFVS